MQTRADRIAGGIVGLLVGDALGVPYEFKPAHEIPAEQDIEFEPPGWFSRSHASVRPGTWSDDGAQALCLLASLLHQGSFDPDDFGRRMVNWFEHGYMAVGDTVFDVGGQTAASLRAISRGVPTLSAASRDVTGNGNGALMRVLPLALWHRGPDEALIRDARLSSVVTHGHVRSQLCCALYCVWARQFLHDDPDPWRTAVAQVRASLRDASEVQELELHVKPDRAPAGEGSGYVVDSLHGARMLLLRGDYEAVVKGAVLLGDDTDTTAAIAGGVAGVRDGLEGIPLRFREALRGKELYEPLLARLASLRT